MKGVKRARGLSVVRGGHCDVATGFAIRSEHKIWMMASGLRVDERTDVLISLSLCLRCLKSLGDDPGFWKWAILSLHNALQGAMVCHLSGTAQLGALSDKSDDDWLAWHERDRRGEIKCIEDGTDELGIPKTRFASSLSFQAAGRRVGKEVPLKANGRPLRKKK